MAYYCAFNTTSFNTVGSLSFPLWTGGSTTTSWEVEVDFSVTSLASQITLVGNTGAVSGAFDIFTNGAIGLRAWVASAAGLVVVGNRYTAKVTREGTNTLRVYLKLASESTYGAAVATYSTANTIPYNALGRNQNTPVVRAVNFYGAKLTGGTYGETWSGLNAPSTGTTWTGANGNQITLQGTQGTADAWWVFYNSGATYQLTALGGTFTYSGQTAALNRGFKLAAQGGIYSYTGASANLSYTTATIYRLDALGASYSYAGASASLLRGFVLDAQGGAYSYAGASTSLLRGFKLAANGGAYSYAGASASLTYVSGPTVYRLTALGVTYVYSGGAAALTTTGITPAANPSAFVNRARVAGAQTVPAKVGSLLVNNARIDGMLINKGRLAQ